jgi:hypothetical protein
MRDWVSLPSAAIPNSWLMTRFCVWTSPSNLAMISWVFVIFGEHQVMAQLIAKSVLISLLIHKDFPVRYPLLARGNCTSVTLNHQK